MDRSEPHELLSAYLDGEVTPEERAEAERLLESSPELRGDLDDFARLSDLIRGLPRESAPSDLAAAIRRQAERQALLGPEPTVAKRSLRREIVSVLIGMAVTAAGMLIMLQTVNRGVGQLVWNDDFVEEQSVDRSVSAKTAAKREGSSVAMDAAAPPAAATVALQNQPEDKPQEMTAGPVTAPAAPLMAKKSGLMMAPAKPVSELAKSEAKLRDGTSSVAGFGGAPESLERLAEANGSVNWRSVRIGDVVPYFERTGNGVAVVELTVVDINQAADQMEVLLERYNLPVLQDQEGSSDERANARRGKKSPAAKSGELVTVYVEAPSGDLVQFLNEMDEQKVFLTAQLQPPVDVPPMAEPAEVLEQSDHRRSESDVAAKEAEQLVKQEAAEATNQYVASRFLSNRQLAATVQDKAGDLAQKPGAASPLNRSASKGQTVRGAGQLNRKAVQQEAKQDRETDLEQQGPADALAAVLPPPQPMNNARQRSAMAIQNTVNTSQALLANHALVAGKQANSVAEKSASNTPADADSKAGGKDRAAVDAPAGEPLPSPTVRLLFVLQQAAPVGTPPE